MDHHRTLPGAIGRLVFEVEAFGQVEVDLDRGHLPCPSDRILGLDGDLRPVERGASLVQDEFEPLPLRGLAQHLGRLGPDLVAAHALLRVPRGELEIEVGQAVVAEETEDEGQEVVQLVGHLLTRAIDMCVILGESPGPGQTLHHAGLLVSIDGPELEQPQGKLPVGTATCPVDQVVHGAVHRLEVVVLGLLAHVAVRVDFPVQLHRRIHALGVPVQVTGLLEERTLGDVGAVHELVAGLLVAATGVVLHHPTHHASLGMEDG